MRKSSFVVVLEPTIVPGTNQVFNEHLISDGVNYQQRKIPCIAGGTSQGLLNNNWYTCTAAYRDFLPPVLIGGPWLWLLQWR